MANILVVDDLVLSHRLLHYTLKKNGHRVIAAYNGHEALERLAAEPVELIISDLAMPEMDGMTLLKQLRADDCYCHLPIIMLTASGQDQDRVMARAEGADYFLTKPTSTVELIETVNRALTLQQVS